MELREREIDLENASFNLIQAESTNEFAGSLSASFGVPGVTQDPVEPGGNFIYRLKLEDAGTFKLPYRWY